MFSLSAEKSVIEVFQFSWINPNTELKLWLTDKQLDRDFLVKDNLGLGDDNYVVYKKVLRLPQ